MVDIFDPLRINSMRLPNRFFRSATEENFADSGRVSERLLAIYGELARGRIGLIVTGGIYPVKAGQIDPGQLGADTDEAIPGLRRLVAVVHENRARIAAQLMHSGWLCPHELTGAQPVGPSATVCPHSGVQVRELSGDEIEELVNLFVQASRRIIEAGFDAIQLHGAHSHLISSFLSPVTNRRDDEWGGTSEKRSRFVRRIYRGIRNIAGRGYPILIKLGLVDYHPQGKSLSEGIETAKLLEVDGIDAIEISEGLEEIENYHIRLDSTSPYYMQECRQARRFLSVPLILVGGMRVLEDMQSVLHEGAADGISMCRPFINDPHLVLKFQEGMTDHSECDSCNYCLDNYIEKGLCCVKRQ